MDIVRGTTSRFTFDPTHDVQAQWSADGGQIVFGSVKQNGIMNIYRKNATGAGSEDAVLALPESTSPTDWSSDGRHIVYDFESPKTLMDIWVMPLSGERKPVAYLQTAFAEGQGRLSSDSRWIAYASNETGRNEVYVQPFPAAAGKWQIPTGGGAQPRWRADGKELYYLSAQDQELIAINAVPVRASATTFDVGAPAVLFTTRLGQSASLNQGAVTANTILQSYAPSADGQRFFLLRPGVERPNPPVTVVVNWMAALNK